MKKMIDISICAVLALAFVACGNNNASDTENTGKADSTTIVDDSKNSDQDDTGDKKSGEELSTIQDFFNQDNDTAQLKFGVYDSAQDAMVSHAVFSAIPASAAIDKTQYWLTGDKSGDLKTSGSDESIKTAGNLAQIDGAVWSADFSYATKKGRTYVSIFCQEDWELAKSSKSGKPNYKEGTYNNVEYITYDVEKEGDNSLYTSIKLNGDYYLHITLNMQNGSGVMYEIDDKLSVIESIIDKISAE